MAVHPVRFPGESEAYRAARDRLLEKEIELRQGLETGAALRRELPLGGRVKEDYVFEEAKEDQVRSVRLSELFSPGRHSLIVYSYMYGPAAAQPCPMCTCFLDGVNAYEPHLTQRLNLVVVAKSPADRLRLWAARRGRRGAARSRGRRCRARATGSGGIGGPQRPKGARTARAPGYICLSGEKPVLTTARDHPRCPKTTSRAWSGGRSCKRCGRGECTRTRTTSALITRRGTSMPAARGSRKRRSHPSGRCASRGASSACATSARRGSSTSRTARDASRSTRAATA